MANKKPKQNKPKTGLARCLELASNKKGLVFLSAILSSLAAIASFVPYIAVYFIISSILKVYPNLELLDMSKVMNYGWIALAGIIANILLYFLAIFSSHMAAFGTLYELKLHFAEHITKIPLGYHLTIGSGRLRKIMDENIESIEGFIAHQFPDFVASVTAPIVMVIILLAIDWRFGIASLVGIVLAFVVQFSGFGSGAMKENMGKYQIALEDMNNASVEYVRGMPVVKAFNQTASSFARLEHAIKEYTEWVLKFSLGWQNYMPAFTTIINNIYLVIVPVGILLGANAQDYKSFTMTFIFYLLFVPAIAGILNKIMYISESFMQIDGNVARMDEIFNILKSSKLLRNRIYHCFFSAFDFHNKLMWQTYNRLIYFIDFLLLNAKTVPAIRIYAVCIAVLHNNFILTVFGHNINASVLIKRKSSVFIAVNIYNGVYAFFFG